MQVLEKIEEAKRKSVADLNEVRQIHMNKHLIRFGLLRASELTRPFKY